MSNDLISRKSVLDYIEKEIATAKCTETISYLRALSVHINEYEPTAYKVDKVVEHLEELKDIHFVRFDRYMKQRQEELAHKHLLKVNTYHKAIDIVKAGVIDE